MGILFKIVLVFLILIVNESVFCKPSYNSFGNDNSRFARALPVVSNVNDLTYPMIYSLARLPLEHKNQDSDVESSEQVEHTDNKKVLLPPIAFSYNSEDDKEDLKSSATHKHSSGGKKQHESGEGKSHYADHHKSGGKKEDKGYKGFDDHDKKEKGHYDKEGHKGSYSDEGGKKKNHFHEDDYSGEHHKGDKGEKKSKFEEDGKHEKGHSTKGGHSINKKDHFEKKHEFFDEYYEGGDQEKHGGFHAENDYHKGGSKKGGHHKSGEHEDHYGKKGHHEKGDYYDDKKGHKKEAGHSEHHAHDEKYGKEEAKKAGKKWGYKEGDDDGGSKKKSGKYEAHESKSVPSNRRVDKESLEYVDAEKTEKENIVKVKEEKDTETPAETPAEQKNEYKVYEDTSADVQDYDSGVLETLESIVKSLQIDNKPKPNIYKSKKYKELEEKENNKFLNSPAYTDIATTKSNKILDDYKKIENDGLLQFITPPSVLQEKEIILTSADLKHDDTHNFDNSDKKGIEISTESDRPFIKFEDTDKLIIPTIHTQDSSETKTLVTNINNAEVKAKSVSNIYDEDALNDQSKKSSEVIKIPLKYVKPIHNSQYAKVQMDTYQRIRDSTLPITKKRHYNVPTKFTLPIQKSNLNTGNKPLYRTIDTDVASNNYKKVYEIKNTENRNNLKGSNNNPKIYKVILPNYQNKKLNKQEEVILYEDDQILSQSLIGHNSELKTDNRNLLSTEHIKKPNGCGN